MSEASADRVVIDVTVKAPERLANGALISAGFDLRDYENGVGWPALRLPVGLPAVGDFNIEVAVRGLTPLDLRLSDLPRRLPDDAADAAELDDTFDKWKAADDQGFVAWQEPIVCDYLRILPLRVLAVRPLRDGNLYAPEAIRITVRISGGATDRGARRVSAAPEALPSPAIAAVVNPAQAWSWRAPTSAPRRVRADGFSTATSDWIRIETDRRGVYVLTASDLTTLGIDPASIDLAELRLFCARAGALPDSAAFETLPSWMEPCSLLVEDDGDQIWDASTRVYFLGNGPDGWRDDLGLPIGRPGFRWYAHPHSRHFTYWLCWGGDFSTAPARMTELDANPEGLPPLEVGGERVHVEQNREYDVRPRVHGEWPLFFQLYIRGGQIGNANLALPDVQTSSAATLRVCLWGAGWTGSWEIDYDHIANVFANGDSVASVSWRDVGTSVAMASLSAPQPSNLITVRAPSIEYDDAEINHIYLDWIEADYEKPLVVSNDSLAFFADAGLAALHSFRVTGLSADSGWLLLDASAPRAPRVLQPVIAADGVGYSAEFRVTPAAAAAHLVLLQRQDAARPANLSRVTWHRNPLDPALRDRDWAIDYIVVTADEYRDAAEALGEHREQNYWGADGATRTGGRVAVVGVSRIMDEFAWGQHDPTALRRFLSYARDNWRGGAAAPTLTHVVLLGNANYDPRGYIAGSAPDALPSFQFYEWYRQLSAQWVPAFFTDDWFTWLDGPDDLGPDIAIGRLPAATSTQAANMVAKIIAYDNAPPPGEWRTRLTIACDDVCQGTEADELGFDHIRQSELLCNLSIPGDARLRKIYLYEYGTECIYDRKPAATADLLATIADGTLLFNFVGHGSEVQLADERLIERSTVPSMMNDGKPFFMITASCAVGKFAHGGDGLGLNMIRAEGGAALAVLSASSMAAAWSNFNLNSDVLSSIFPQHSVLEPVALGLGVQRAKITTVETNDWRYNYFGDPASRFAVPGNTIELWLDDVPGMSAYGDTLIRGGGATLHGIVRDLSGQQRTDFNGEAEILVLDSDIYRHPVPTSTEEDYMLPGARIYSGQAQVRDGVLSCPFFVPTTLRRGERGPARIYAYALEDGGTDTDAGGALSSLTIPEIGLEPSDVTPPEITLQWEDPGAEIAPGSRIVAAFSDSSGIYVAALAASRSVIVTIAGDDERILTSQDVADQVSFGENFREGSLEYAIPTGLPEGQPLVLALEASDNAGNRARVTVDFTLAGGESQNVECLGLVYPLPNPIEKDTRFLLELQESADLELTIYTLSGRRIREIDTFGLSPARALAEGIYWDGRDDDGDVLANGVYFYRVKMRSASGCNDERIERLVVSR